MGNERRIKRIIYKKYSFLKKEMRNALGYALILSIATSILAFLVQNNAQQKISRCSYLDPLAIDFFAFIAAFFLIGEGFYRLRENKKDPLQCQVTRAFRIALGCAILTLHIMQVVHK